jgi:hypothetical protein
MLSPGKNCEHYEPGKLSALPGLILPTRQCARLRVADARLKAGISVIDYWTVTVKTTGDESAPDVPVTVTVYVPGGVPPLGGGGVELLPPPQADMKMKPATIMPISRSPRSFFRRELKPAPSSAIPPIGSNMA